MSAKNDDVRRTNQQPVMSVSRQGQVNDLEASGDGVPEVPRGNFLFVTSCILFMELCERLTFYSLTSNMVIFGTNELKYTTGQAVNVNFIFTGICYFIPVLGGWIADSIAGRYNTIFGSGLVYLLGTVLMPAVAVNYQKVFGAESDMSLIAKRAFYLVGLGLVAIGTGGIKSNVSPFGAQQVEPHGKEKVSVFFNWFYWMINVGSIVSFTGVAYVQQNIGFDIGYIIPAAALLVSVIIFIIPRNKYIKTPPTGSVLTSVAKIVKQGLQRRFETENTSKLPSFLDYASESNGGDFPDLEVDGVKAVWRMTPVLFTFVMYWTVSNQIYNTFLVQGERMNLSLGSFTLPAATLSIFDALMILLLVPLMDRVVYPLLAKFNRKPTLLQRIGVGLLFATGSMVCAGVLEIYRKKDIEQTGGISQNVAGVVYNASTMSVLWQVPQMALVGAGEVFTSITSLEFAYDQAPVSLQGLVMGLCLLTNGLGNFLGSAILSIVGSATKSDPWFPNEINTGHAENLMFLLAGLMLADFLLFLVIAKLYKYSTFSHSQSNQSPDTNLDQSESDERSPLLSGD